MQDKECQRLAARSGGRDDQRHRTVDDAQADLNGDGTVDRVLTDAVTLNANGSRTETVTETNGSGSLRAKTITTMSADGRSTTVTRDTNGDGNLDDTRTITTAANGVVTDEVVHLAPNGSVIDRTTTTTSADGNTITVGRDVNGDGTVDTKTVRSVVLNGDGSTTETTTTYAGTTRTSSKTVVTSSDGRSITTSKDFDGNGVVDLTTTDATVLNANGSRVETLANTATDGSLRDKTLTTTSADGRNVTVAIDVLGSLDTATVTLSKSIVVQADGKEVVTVTYPNTPSPFSTEVDTRTRSANGLSSSTSISDVNGPYINVSSATTLNSDGSRTEAFTNNDPWGYDVTTTTSATGLSRTIQMSGAVNDFDPMLTMNATDVTVLNADGSTAQTITSAIAQTTSNSTGGTSKSVTTISDDRLATSLQIDVNNDGRFDRTDTTVIGTDGSATRTLTLLNYGTGALVQKDVLTTSFDGRTQSLQRDTNGDGIFDHFETTAMNADGSITGTTSDTTASGGLLDRFVVTTAANGLSKSSTMDVNGDGAIDYSQTVTTTLNADGSHIDVVSDFFGNGTLRDRSVTRTSANGLSKTTAFDLNGDGVVDQWQRDVTVINPDGTSFRDITETYADGTLKSETAHTRDAGAYDSFEETDFDTNGDGNIDRSLTVRIDQDGYRTQDVTWFNPNGSQKRQIDSQNSPDGLSHYIFYGGSTQSGPPNEQFYFIPNANDSYLWNRFTSTTAQTATHTIDPSGGIDHWVWADQTAQAYATNPVFKTLTIDLATESKLIDMTRRIYDTVLTARRPRARCRCCPTTSRPPAYSTQPGSPTT